MLQEPSTADRHHQKGASNVDMTRSVKTCVALCSE